MQSNIGTIKIVKTRESLKGSFKQAFKTLSGKGKCDTWNRTDKRAEVALRGFVR